MRVEGHFDESGTHDSQLTLAGYLFEADRIDRFCEIWHSILREKELPFFHMVDVAHGNPPFEKLDRSELIRLQMRLMRLIKRYSINGIVCNITNFRDNSGKSYLEGVQGAVKLALEWADKAAFDGKIAYFFEAGAQGQGLADAHFHQIAADPANSAVHRYAGHAFVPKAGNPGVQAADLLSWQYHNFTKKRASDSLARLDLRALLRHPHLMSDECGELPRAPKMQSVDESRFRMETVYYLPAATEAEMKDATVFQFGSDKPAMRGKSGGNVLACPNCYRAVCEDVSLAEFWSWFGTDARFFILSCWCGTYCRVPEIMVPLAHQ